MYFKGKNQFMKIKTTALILILFIVISCTKSHSYKYCYHCTFGINTPSRPPLDTCSDVDASHYSFKDANGNSFGFSCELK
jgi:hypothetical protein